MVNSANPLRMFDKKFQSYKRSLNIDKMLSLNPPIKLLDYFKIKPSSNSLIQFTLKMHSSSDQNVFFGDEVFFVNTVTVQTCTN